MPTNHLNDYSVLWVDGRIKLPVIFGHIRASHSLKSRPASRLYRLGNGSHALCCLLLATASYCCRRGLRLSRYSRFEFANSDMIPSDRNKRDKQTHNRCS